MGARCASTNQPELTALERLAETVGRVLHAKRRACLSLPTSRRHESCEIRRDQRHAQGQQSDENKHEDFRLRGRDQRDACSHQGKPRSDLNHLADLSSKKPDRACLKHCHHQSAHHEDGTHLGGTEIELRLGEQRERSLERRQRELPRERKCEEGEQTPDQYSPVPGLCRLPCWRGVPR